MSKTSQYWTQRRLPGLQLCVPATLATHLIDRQVSHLTLAIKYIDTSLEDHRSRSGHLGLSVCKVARPVVMKIHSTTLHLVRHESVLNIYGSSSTRGLSLYILFSNLTLILSRTRVLLHYDESPLHVTPPSSTSIFTRSHPLTFCQ